MAHWHDFNPWADRLIYLPDLEELARCVNTSRSVEEIMKLWLQSGPKADVYLLHQPDGRYEAGIRYGQEPSDYISPFCDQSKLAKLAERYA